MSDPSETKKRSLSSYLSNVSSRREELEMIKQKQQEEQQKQEHEKVRQEHLKQGKLKEEKLKEEQFSQIQLKKEELEEEQPSEVEQSKDNVKKEDVEEQGGEQEDEQDDNQANEQDDNQADELPKNRRNGATISRVELHSILKAPADGSHDEEVDSDAPTEPASPPKPKRGRLVRGDRLTSLSPRQVSFYNGSDSELSDIDELEAVNISSSVLHGDSSPAKRHSSPNKASKPFRQHRKGIYRDAGGRTRLQIACDKGNREISKRLIEEDGYDVNDQDNAGNTALHEAALNGHLDIVKLLVNHGADVNVQSYEMFKDTPLIDASANAHLPVVEFLLEHGADPLVCNAKGFTAYDSIDDDADLDDDERDIVRQIQHCLRDATKKALDHTANTKDPSPAQTKLSDDDYEFNWTDISSRAGREKLLNASKEGKLAYVGSYLENGGKIDVKAFFEAVKFGHEDITSLFLAFGAPVNVSLKDGITVLMAAVGRGHQGIAKLLLDADADPVRMDKMGHNALYYAENSPTGIVDTGEVAMLKDVMRRRGVKTDDGDTVKKRKIEQVESEQNNIQEGEPETKKQEVEPEEPKETPAEREAKLKAEEEYFQRRMQNKKKKEQELLKKLAFDEQKREEEKKKQRLQEQEKMEADKKQRQLELRENQRQLELQKRKDIRSRYPLGLKLVDFNNYEDLQSFLPLYYVNIDGEKYVLDLQVCVLLKDPSVISSRSTVVESLHRGQLWNILKFIFLQGGNSNKLNLDDMTLDSRIRFETQEYVKFSQLPMHWIPYQSISHKLGSREQMVKEQMVEIVLADARNFNETRDQRHCSSPISLNRLPFRFQYRSEILESLSFHNAGPLW